MLGNLFLSVEQRGNPVGRCSLGDEFVVVVQKGCVKDGDNGMLSAGQ